MYKLSKAAVILGVVGELLGDGGLFEAGDRLQTLEEKAISQANIKAAQANERAMQLEKEAAEAKERVAKDELALAKMNTARKIDDRQYTSLVTCLRNGPKGLVYVRPGFFDQDARELGERIKAALKDADFPDPPPWPGGNSAREAMTWNTPGVFLVVQNLENPPLGAAALQQCLIKAGIETPAYPNADEPEGTISIGIGPRF